ncbi:MAG: hypothetical protein C0621_03880 [Desulfuromonas sp.]|nr:MAG: hypothetical protein C0621_03880 [Desulfuromonas sp.]
MSKFTKEIKNFFIDKEIEYLAVKHNVISNFESDCLSGASYDLRVGSTVVSRNKQSTFDISNSSYIVESGEVVTIETLEKIDFNAFLCSGIISNKHSILAKGFFHPITVIDPGFNGKLVLTFINLGNTRFTITKGDKLAKLLISPVSKLPTRIYGDTQSPSFREGSLAVASVIEKPNTDSEDLDYSKMYGEPISHLYERVELLEKEYGVYELKSELKRKKEKNKNILNTLLALLSGVSGALVTLYWGQIKIFIKGFVN